MKCQKVSKNRASFSLEIIIAILISSIFIILISDITYSNKRRLQYVFVRRELINNFQHKYIALNPDSYDLVYKERFYNEKIGNIDWVYSKREFLNVGDEYDYYLTATTSLGMPVNLFMTKIVGLNKQNDIHSSSNIGACSVDMIHQYNVGSYDFWIRDNPFLGTKSDIEDESSFTIDKYIRHLNVHDNFQPTDMYLSSTTIFVSEDSNTISDPDIYVFDIRDQNTLLKSSINTGPGIARLTIHGEYIFVANRSTTQQLQILRYSNQNLEIVSRFRLPLPSTTSAPTLGSSIAYNGEYLILGTEKWDGNEINIFDIHNIQNPVLISGIEIGSRVSDLRIVNNRMFVANSGAQQLLEYDISNPYIPALITSFQYSGSERQDGKTINIFENSVTFGRSNGGFNIDYQYELYHYKNILRDGQSDSHYLDIPQGVYGLINDRKHIYLLTRQTGREFSVLKNDLSTTSLYTNLDTQPKRIFCFGHKIYILSEQSPFIYELYFRKK